MELLIAFKLTLNQPLEWGNSKVYQFIPVNVSVSKVNKIGGFNKVLVQSARSSYQWRVGQAKDEIR